MAPPYVHAGITRPVADERVIAAGDAQGTFLVREKDGKQALCIMYKGKRKAQGMQRH